MRLLPSQFIPSHEILTTPSISTDVTSLLSHHILRLLRQLPRLSLYLPNNSLNPARRLLLRHLLFTSPLMVLHPPVSLGKLCALVDEVAEEEEVVLRLDGECVAHEGCGIDGKGASHLTRNPERVMLAYAHLFIQYIRSNRSGMVVEALQEELTVQGSFAYPSQRQLGYRNSKLDPRNLMTSPFSKGQYQHIFISLVAQKASECLCVCLLNSTPNRKLGMTVCQLLRGIEENVRVEQR